ncbi:MAG TPA: N,N-dimethylformamidase beta subunit family domain-containing protein [Ilumatobacter sp.]|nr:N,N-dimethylformamidase beta subunit family domain-containing protein [Ilumatobacter sp.]
MRLLGYSDVLSVEPGGTIRFMVSSEADTFDAELVRLRSSDDVPADRHELVESTLTGTHPGEVQHLRLGSYVRVATPSLTASASFGCHMWICPTTPGKEYQTLISRRSDRGIEFALRLEGGHLTLQVGADRAARLQLSRKVVGRHWYSVTASYDAATAVARLDLHPLEPTAAELGDRAEGVVAGGPRSGSGELVLAAEQISHDSEVVVGNFYNGKIDAPVLVDYVLADAEIDALRSGRVQGAPGLVAAWDFSRDITSSTVTDISPNQLHGKAVNRPMRGVTGWNWDGTETAWPSAPEQYGAIHFHEDDLDDADWKPSLTWTVPTGLTSGIYAVHLSAGDDHDHIPFVVRPPRGAPSSRIALLVPTFSYLAYANEHTFTSMDEERLAQLLSAGRSGPATQSYPATPADRYMVANRLHSTYDSHVDGSGVCYSSRLRPLLSMRAGYQAVRLDCGAGSPHQFSADLHLVEWLDELGYQVDMFADEDLHEEGAELLSSYDVVLTGTHHEYWTLEMILGARQYLEGGGRLMYLSGNGMYWVTQYDPDTHHSIEVRRAPPSTRSWETAPGEAHLSSTGELGGLWRYRGHAPQSWLGVGFTSQGVGPGRPYVRQPDSFADDMKWVFDGVDDESIGDFPSRVNSYGAASFEIDRVDHTIGSPLRTRLLATASGFSDHYQHAIEEVRASNSAQGGSVNPLVRADLVLLEYPNGGAVFSTGSIGWCACLSYRGNDNNVSRITKNVLDRFSRAAADA